MPPRPPTWTPREPRASCRCCHRAPQTSWPKPHAPITLRRQRPGTLAGCAPAGSRGQAPSCFPAIGTRLHSLARGPRLRPSDPAAGPAPVPSDPCSASVGHWQGPCGDLRTPGKPRLSSLHYGRLIATCDLRAPWPRHSCCHWSGVGRGHPGGSPSSTCALS